MSLSDKSNAATLDMILRDQANPYTYLTNPEKLELALFVSASSLGVDPGGSLPDGDNPVTGEVTSGVGYERVAVEFGTAATVADPSVVSNDAAINFATATGDWAAGANFVNGWSLYDVHATPGSRVSIWTGPFDSGKNVLTNDTVTVAIGNLTLRLRQP